MRIFGFFMTIVCAICLVGDVVLWFTYRDPIFVICAFTFAASGLTFALPIWWGDV